MDLAAISAALATLFEERIANQINRATVLMQVLPVGDGTTGKDLGWDVRFSGTNNAGVIADGADVAGFSQDDKVPARLEFGTYHDAFSITGKALAGAAASGNPQQLQNLFGEELVECVERLAKAIHLDLFDGDGSTDTIHGLVSDPGAITDTGSYAGIDRAVRTEWAGNVNANGGVGRALTFALMREMRRQIYTASGEKPDLIVTTPAIHEHYASLFGDNRRYVQEVRLRGQKIVLDGGHQALEFDGIPIFEDVDCPAGQMLFLTSRHIKIAQLPDPATDVNQSRGHEGLKGTPEDQLGEGMERLRARINPLGRSGDAYKFQLICYPQLQVKRCNAHGVLDDIDPDA